MRTQMSNPAMQALMTNIAMIWNRIDVTSRQVAGSGRRWAAFSMLQNGGEL